MIKTPPDLLGQASAARGDAAAAARILPLVDLTSLNDADDEAAIARLCDRARSAGVAARSRAIPSLKPSRMSSRSTREEAGRSMRSAISFTRPMCETAPVITKPIVPNTKTTIGSSQLPSQGTVDHSKAKKKQTPAQASTRRNTNRKLRIR